MLLLLLAGASATGQNAPMVTAEWKQVEDAMGRPGQMQPGNVLKFSMPRRDMSVTVDGTAIKPGFAQAIHDALAVTKTPPASTQPTAPPAFELDHKQIERILGRSGKVNGGILQFSVPRNEKITDEEMEIPPAMGVATAINFQPAGNGRAATTGDFVLIANEVNPVIKALRDHGIQVTALHSHMLTEQPRLFFMHFWAVDDPGKLTGGLRAALDHTNNAKP